MAEEKTEIRKLLAEAVSVSEVSRRFTDPKAGKALSRATVINIRDHA